MICFSFASKASTQIIIETQSDVADGYGGFARTWSTTYTVWAYIEPKGGKEVFVSEQTQSRVDSVIVIRYISALSNTKTGAKYRVNLGGRYFNILAVLNLSGDLKSEGATYQKLICQEGPANA